MADKKNTYVISDLHMGNGSALDQFEKSGAEDLFFRFLDYVAQEEGHLVIAGDLLELWRFNLSEVVDYRSNFLDRLAALKPDYIPGNHDPLTQQDAITPLHPLFEHIRQPFTQQIGMHRVRFMHGHEVDPLTPKSLYNRSLPNFILPAFVLKDSFFRMTGDSIPDLLLEWGEHLSRLLQGQKNKAMHRIHPALVLSQDPLRKRLKYPVRTQKMLSRLHFDRDEISYDMVVVGHTHKAGQYNRWYFNSGCWIKPTHSFLRIRPDGHVEVFDWGRRGAHLNSAEVWPTPTH